MHYTITRKFMIQISVQFLPFTALLILVVPAGRMQDVNVSDIKFIVIHLIFNDIHSAGK